MPAPDASPLIDAALLSVQRGGRMIFRGLSVSAAPGEAVTVTGPNGSGKSTLLRVLAGLGRSDTGTVKHSPDDLGALRYAGHRDGLKNGLTVRENLSVWAALYGLEPDQVDTVIERFGLNSVSDMPVDVLSAGWRRRSGLARIGLGDAPLWILDEPYTALDKDNAARLDGIFAEHCSGGGAIILATHQTPGFAVTRTLDVAAFAVPMNEQFKEAAW